jgi:hypothetical protein
MNRSIVKKIRNSIFSTTKDYINVSALKSHEPIARTVTLKDTIM